METLEHKCITNIIVKDRYMEFVTTIILIKFLVVSLTFGFTKGFFLFAAFFLGIFLFNHIFKNRQEIENLLSPFIVIGTKSQSEGKNSGCSICGNRTCNREKVHHKKPWSGLMVPSEVDQAVSELLQKTLDEFVSSWLKDITCDESFQQELKEVVRHAASVVLHRTIKVDVAGLLTTKGLQVVARHAVALEQMASGHQTAMHPALASRQAELDYLRDLITRLLPLLLAPHDLNSRTFAVLVREILSGWLLLPISDSVSDPLVLNSLLLLLMGRQPLTQYPPDSLANRVEFLAEFASKNKQATNASALRPDMCTILKDQSLLYAFMQHLKSRGAVYILQFCLDVEEFNRRMLTPELSSDDLDLLYRDAWDLYSVYFSPHSPDTLNFPDQLVTQMRKVLSKDVTKLRTSPPLFQAYEYAYSLLDNTYCPQFHSSDDFYTWLCGPKILLNVANSGARANRKHLESGAVSRISSRLTKLKGALKASPVTEGQLFEASVELDSDCELTEALEYESERDLSAWRVSIPTMTVRVDPITCKATTVFTINIQRIDVAQGDSSQWTVERKLADFYSLDAKLTEFHGEFSDAQLPPRRQMTATSPMGRPDTLQVYEEYLQKLLSKPALRGSDLLFSFLACPGEFVAEDSSLGRLLSRGFPITLRKERGQHLEPFINTFFASTESRVRHSKLEYKDMSQEVTPRNVRNIVSPVFGDNLGVGTLPELIDKPPSVPATPIHTLIYIGVNIFRWSKPTIQLAIALQNLFGNTVDALIKYWVNNKLHKIFVPQRIAHLIKLLQWAVFESKGKADREQVARAVELQTGEKGEWSRLVYQSLYLATQTPLLNKQVFYCLLDELILELFPELKDDKPKE